jgi:hypothetical protein
MLFISTGIFYDKLHPQILSVGTTANAALRKILPIGCFMKTISFLLKLVKLQQMKMMKQIICWFL